MKERDRKQKRRWPDALYRNVSHRHFAVRVLNLKHYAMHETMWLTLINISRMKRVIGLSLSSCYSSWQSTISHVSQWLTFRSLTLIPHSVRSWSWTQPRMSVSFTCATLELTRVKSRLCLKWSVTSHGFLCGCRLVIHINTTKRARSSLICPRERNWNMPFRRTISAIQQFGKKRKNRAHMSLSSWTIMLTSPLCIVWILNTIVEAITKSESNSILETCSWHLQHLDRFILQSTKETSHHRYCLPHLLTRKNKWINLFGWVKENRVYLAEEAK